jgi:predicted nucleic acid-binding protein
VALILDASALYAQANRSDADHLAVANVLREERGTLVTTELVVAEADYLLLTRLGLETEFAFLEDLAEGTFVIECLTRGELGLARDLARSYRDLRLGLADCSLIVLAARYRTTRIATLDIRHFRAVTPLQGGHFTLLPADSV